MTCGHIRQEMPEIPADKNAFGNYVPAHKLPCATPGCQNGAPGDALKFMEGSPTPSCYITLERKLSGDGWRWNPTVASGPRGDDLPVTNWTDIPVDVTS